MGNVQHAAWRRDPGSSGDVPDRRNTLEERATGVKCVTDAGWGRAGPFEGLFVA